MSHFIKQHSLFDDMRMTLEDSIAISLQSLQAYGEKYSHWAIAYSGGKDSTATVTFVDWAIRSGAIKAPQTLTILYADTRMELPPLQKAAMQLMKRLNENGTDTRVVLPTMDDRFFVYMLGRGVPPPKNRFRWCTPQLKVEPMMASLEDLREQSGEKFLSITGVRLGESEARDQRIALSCSKDSGECGQGWFQVTHSDAIADTLAPLVHWRVCHVFDWLTEMRHGYSEVLTLFDVYGAEDVRTGCVGCNLASRDNALENLVKQARWSHLAPLLELKPLYKELTMAKHRKRKSIPDRRKDGNYAKNGQRLGPLKMASRRYGLDRVLDIQDRAQMDLINLEEEARIRDLWTLNTWPNGWQGNEIGGEKLIDSISVSVTGELVVQPLLISR